MRVPAIGKFGLIRYHRRIKGRRFSFCLAFCESLICHLVQDLSQDLHGSISLPLSEEPRLPLFIYLCLI